MVAETARSENRSIVNVPQTASETVAFDETSSPVRMPEHIARNSNRLNSLPSIRQSQSDETFEQEEPGADSPVMVLGKEDIALVREVPGTEWAWLPVSKRLNADAVVLVPAPFSAVFRFVNGVIVETTGDTRIQILPPDESGRPVIAFDYGHLTVSTGWKRNPDEVQSGDISRSLRIVTPVGSGVLRLTDSRSFVSVDSENRTSVKLLKVTRPYESVTRNPLFYTANLENNVTYCPNLTAFPAEKQSIFWRKDGNEAEWELAAVSVFPIDIEKNVGPIIVFDTNDLIVTPPIVWPSLVSHDGNIPISKLDLKNQFVTMPYTFYPTPSKTWLLK